MHSNEVQVTRGERPRSGLLLMITAFAGSALLGCGQHRDRAVTSQDSTAQTVASQPASGAPPASVPASTPTGEPDVTAATLTVADLDLYKNAMRARIDAVKQMRAKLAEAKTSADSMRIATSFSAASADSVVAHNAGVTPARIPRVVKTVGDILATMQAAGMTSNVGSTIDTVNMPADKRAGARQMLAELRQRSDSDVAAATAGMSPAVATALTQRRAALDSLRNEAVKTAFGGST
jgi:hypothetical protein